MERILSPLVRWYLHPRIKIQIEQKVHALRWYGTPVDINVDKDKL